jgi:hypothetical protein
MAARLMLESEGSCRAAEILDSASFPADMSPRILRKWSDAAVRKIKPIILRVQARLQGIQRQHGTYSTISCPSAAELRQ